MYLKDIGIDGMNRQLWKTVNAIWACKACSEECCRDIYIFFNEVEDK